MFSKVIAIALLVLALAVPLDAAGQSVMKADATHGVRYATERVVDLPQDRDTPYLTVFGAKNDPRTQALVQWFEKHNTLKAIKDQTHYRVIYTDDPMFERASVPALPCVRMNAADRETMVEFSGDQIPMSADALAKGLNKQASEAECLRRRRQAQPQPAPNPDTDPAPAPLVKPTPKPPAPKETIPWLLLGILAVLGGLAGAYKYFGDLYKVRK